MSGFGAGNENAGVDGFLGGNGSVGNETLLGLEEYGSDAALAAVELFIGYPDWLLTFASLCCCLFMVIGVPGNLITIVALARCKKVSIPF